MANQAPLPVQARLIRLAMLGGALLFGATTYWIRRTGDAAAPVAGQANALVLAGRVVWGAAVVGCVFLYQLFRRRPIDPAKEFTYAVFAWALGEATALFGGAIWFSTGVASWYIPGLVFLCITLLVFSPGTDR